MPSVASPLREISDNVPNLINKIKQLTAQPSDAYQQGKITDEQFKHLVDSQTSDTLDGAGDVLGNWWGFSTSLWG